jgi:hypothetical protein
MKQIFCGIFVLILVCSLVFGAETFSTQAGFDWLSSKMGSDGSFESDVSKTALAIAALDSVGYDTTLSQDWLDTKLSSDGCYPSGACDTKATGLSVIALNEVQDDTNFEDILAWYENSQSEASVNGGWYLEVITSGTGNCVVSYDLEGTLKEINVAVDSGAFTGCGGSHFLDLDDCLQAGLISANPGIELNVDCSELEGSVVLTLLYRSDSTYYILSNINSAEGDFVVPNGCFGKSKSASCDLESTLYSDWAMKYLKGNMNHLVYLKENYDTSDPKKVALMYLVTGEDKYLTDLAELQKSDGSFNRDPYTTGLAVLALKGSGDYSQNVEDAKSYLREEQSDSGDWGSVEATAMVLYGVFSEDEVTPSETIETTGEEEVDECEVDSDCGSGYECKYGSCKVLSSGCTLDDDCDAGEVCIDGGCIESECNGDGNCEYPKWDENAYNCPSDCSCGDDVCDNVESSSSSEFYCAEDCVTSSATTTTTTTTTPTTKEADNGWIVYVIILLLIVALGTGGYFAYKKGYLDSLLQKFKKGGSGGGAQYNSPDYNPFTSKMPPQQRSF